MSCRKDEKRDIFVGTDVKYERADISVKQSALFKVKKNKRKKEKKRAIDRWVGQLTPFVDY